jgi:hypothetical protein
LHFASFAPLRETIEAIEAKPGIGKKRKTMGCQERVSNVMLIPFNGFQA